MTPKEKAQQLKIRFFILPEENVGIAKMTGTEVSRLARQCAIIAVDEIIEVIDNASLFRNYTKQPIINYWHKVKEELEIM